jgi:lipoprotein Spr
MLKKLFPFLLLAILLSSCAALKPGFTASKPVASSQASYTTTSAAPNKKAKEVKFLDEISVDPQASVVKYEGTSTASSKKANSSDIDLYASKSSSVEKASALQLKYSVLLNTEVEQLQNDLLLEHVDEWYGTRYRMGGTSKSGIDCSAFVQAVYLSAFAVSLPRTAREQYKTSRIVSSTEIKEGDLVFFNTRGGVSHVGIYLQNNKFIHASTSQGVTVSDLFDPYYLRRFIGAGRIEKPDANAR